MIAIYSVLGTNDGVSSRSSLTHACEVQGGQVARTLCGRVKPENICTDYVAGSAPTCGVVVLHRGCVASAMHTVARLRTLGWEAVVPS